MPQVPLKIHARQQVSLKVASREEQGKGPVGQMRRLHGQLPGVIYGHKQDAEYFKTDAHSLELILSKGGQNAIILIEHEESSKESEKALIRDIQYHKVSGNVMHLDLLRIDPTETLRANVPIVTVGVPEGVRTEGGSLQQTLTAIEMECVVSEMPSAVEIDITSLLIGDSLHVSDLVEQEPRITSEVVRTIVNVLAPRLIVEDEDGDEEEEAADAGGEGEEEAADAGGEGEEE
ncbi:MAG TPA: 50S ribosomal protein L25 [Candidatus Latescibacteria bacterium]|nr:50S ribosomal protein L25 [Candidatus Latescibacterota bacterium]